jgi:hypothetical protein
MYTCMLAEQSSQSFPCLSLQLHSIGILNISLYVFVLNNHRIHEDLQMNTVLSERKKWNTEYLSRLEVVARHPGS